MKILILYIIAKGGVPLEVEVNGVGPPEIMCFMILKIPMFSKVHIIAFKKVVRHYVVKKGFSFVADKAKFIDKCKSKGYPWRIHALMIFYGKTTQVWWDKTHQSLHFLEHYTLLFLGHKLLWAICYVTLQLLE